MRSTGRHQPNRVIRQLTPRHDGLPRRQLRYLLAMTRSNLKLFTPFMVNPLTLVIAKAEPVAIHLAQESEPHLP